MNLKTICLISGILLILAIPNGIPAGYYDVLRIVIFSTSSYLTWGFYKSSVAALSLIFGSIAFLFNPVWPIFLSKSSWVVIDFISAFLFFIVAYSARETK